MPAHSAGLTARSTASATPAIADPAKAIGSPGKITGRVVISSCSLAKVTIDPEKLTEPTRIVNAVATRSKVAISEPRAPSSSSNATSAAAPPPTPLKSATSCGIWVIWTRLAATTPMHRTDGDGRRESNRRAYRSSAKKTVTHASSAPPAPIRLPIRAVFGDDKPLRARMKQTAATR